MLSILIPIYNYDVTQLVKDLLAQCTALDTPTEIVCYDDKSKSTYQHANAWLKDVAGVTYRVLPKNLGRSAIRNQLAKAAVFPYLLYLDCDSGIISDDFLKNYLDHLSADYLVCGGRNYTPQAPKDKLLHLHWLYGSQRETRALQHRQDNPIRYFHTNNFLIPKSAFDRLSFDESIRSYGYEDLVLAENANGIGLSVKHIDNPIRHMELHAAEIFLSKTEAAVKNLIQLNKQGYNFNSKLEKSAYWIKRCGLSSMYMHYFKRNRKGIITNLKSANPSLRNLDLYKLNTYLENQ